MSTLQLIQERNTIVLHVYATLNSAKPNIVASILKLAYRQAILLTSCNVKFSHQAWLASAWLLFGRVILSLHI